MFPSLKKSLKYLKPFKWSFLILLFVTLIENGVQTFSTYFIGRSIDYLNDQNLKVAILFGAIYLASIILPIIIGRFSAFYELYTITFKLDNYFNAKTLSQSLDLSLGQIKNDHSGFKQDLIGKGQNALNNLWFSILYDIFPMLSTLMVALLGLAFINLKYFYITLVFFAIYILWTTYVNNLIRKPLRTLIDKRKEQYKIFVDILRSLFFIKFSGQKRYAVNQLERYQDKYAKFGQKLWGLYHKRSIFSDLLIIVFISTIIVLLFIDFTNGLITVGMFLPVVTWSVQMSNSLGRLKNIQRRLTIWLTDLNKMFEMLEKEPEVKEIEKPLKIKDFKKSIEFKNVSFDYTGGKQGALEDIDLFIKKGEKVALVGKSGSGKSTIVFLLLRIYDPTFGDILIDGVDLRMIATEDWHKMISYVPQDGDLIDMTIKENVLFGAQKRASRSEIVNALKQAEAYDFVEKLPKGLETKVGERGIKLSGGQKQRICIARALIKDSPILVLDEATSSLDSETEQFLNKNIWDILKDKTGVVIAHRLSTILDADKIVVVDDGEVVGIGKHEDLLKNCAFYKKLVDAQNISF